MKRLILLAAILLLSVALPASAKMPPFDLDVDSTGDTVRVEVTIQGDESAIHDFNPSNLDGLIAVYPADAVDAEGRPKTVLQDRTGVRLARIEAGTYQGSVTLEPGRWAVVPFPDIREVIQGSVEGWYPNTVVVKVEKDTTPMWALAALALAIAVAWRYRTRLPI